MPETAMQECGIADIADIEVDGDAVLNPDDRGPFGIGEVAIALQIGEGRAGVECDVAADGGPVFRRDIGQRHRRLLVEAAHIRLREPPRQYRKIPFVELAKREAHGQNLPGISEGLTSCTHFRTLNAFDRNRHEAHGHSRPNCREPPERRQEHRPQDSRGQGSGEPEFPAPRADRAQSGGSR